MQIMFTTELPMEQKNLQKPVLYEDKVWFQLCIFKFIDMISQYQWKEGQCYEKLNRKSVVYRREKGNSYLK